MIITSKIKMIQRKYEIEQESSSIASIRFADGTRALFNKITSQIVGDIDEYSTYCDKQEHLFFQVKTIGESKKIINIYDAEEKKYLVYRWELVKKYGNLDELILLKSPIDGKVHLFDRNYTKILETPLEEAELLYSEKGLFYLSLTINRKKGLYYYNKEEFIKNKEDLGLVTKPEFDTIGTFENIFVYKKGNQQYFSFIGDSQKKKGYFDSIRTEKDHQEILYCKKGDRIDVYDTKNKTCLFSVEADEIKLYKYVYPRPFLILKNAKKGLCIADENHHQIMEPKYDKIENLKFSYYVLYKNGLCDIGTIDEKTPFTPIIKGCEILEKTTNTLTYKKNGKIGVLYYGLIREPKEEIVIPPLYDRAPILIDNCVIPEEAGKKGLMIHGEVQIPIEYDEIKIVGDNGPNSDLNNAGILYASLKSGDECYLARIKDWRYKKGNISLFENASFKSIDFLPQIMVLKTKEHTFVYDYEDHLIDVYPADTKIKTLESDSNKVLYDINGAYYSFNGIAFNEEFSRTASIGILKIEIGGKTYYLTSSSGKDLYTIAQELQKLPDEEAEKIIQTMSPNGFSDNNSTLTRKKQL